MICAGNVFCRNSDCILDAKLPCHILCIAHIVQARLTFPETLYTTHKIQQTMHNITHYTMHSTLSKLVYTMSSTLRFSTYHLFHLITFPPIFLSKSHLSLRLDTWLTCDFYDHFTESTYRCLRLCDGANDEDDVVFFLTSLMSPHIIALWPLTTKARCQKGQLRNLYL